MSVHLQRPLNDWVNQHGHSGLLIVLDDLHLIDQDTRLFIHDLYFTNYISDLVLVYTNLDVSTHGFLNEVHDQTRCIAVSTFA